MTLFKRCYFLFIIGGIGYALIEIISRGYTHSSMVVAGGLSLISIYFINTYFRHKSLMFRAFLSAVAITFIELVIGVLVNRILHLNVWDYSKEPLNLLGQICPQYSLIWFGLSFIVILGMERLNLTGSKTARR